MTIAGDNITDITIVSHEGETTSYFAKARSVVSAILESGTPAGVDAVSGATYSSTGILNAVKQALAKAANPEGTASQPEETETPADGEEAAASEPQVMEPVVEVVQPEEKQPTAREWVTELWQSIFAQEEQPASSEEVPASREAAEEPASSAAEPEGPADLPESTTEEQEGADA